MTRFSRATVGFYRRLLSLYPAPFRETFAAEMVWVFSQSLDDARQRSRAATAGLLLRELGDLPIVILVEHIRYRRTYSMNIIVNSSPKTVRLVRWTARIISALVVAFYVALYLFNEDLRSGPGGAIVFASVLCLIMLAAWRFEKSGGQALMIGALVLPVFIIVENLLRTGSQPFIVPLLLVSVFITMPFFVTGWLFYGVGRQAELAGAGELPTEGAARGVRWLVVVALGLLGVSLIGMLLLGFVVPVSETRSPNPPVIEYEESPPE